MFYILESVLTFSSETDNGKCALFRGMDMQLLAAPFHRLVLCSDLVQAEVDKSQALVAQE